MTHELANPYRGNTHASPGQVVVDLEGSRIHLSYRIGVVGGAGEFISDPDFPNRSAEISGQDYADFLTLAGQYTLAESLSLVLMQFLDARALLTPAPEA